MRLARLSMYCTPSSPGQESGEPGLIDPTLFVPNPCSEVALGYHDYYMQAENGALGRVRSMQESAAIRKRYRANDRWTVMTGPERALLLRKLRADIAREKNIRQSEVTDVQIAKAAGVRPSKLRPYLMNLAGDFVPRKKNR